MARRRSSARKPTNRNRVRGHRALGFAGATALFAAACGGAGTTPGTGQEAESTIVATTSIWADITSRITCLELAGVETLIPEGADPHAFEPSLADRATLEDASLVIANGLLLEQSLDDTLDAIDGGETTVFRVADHFDTTSSDPHIWFDPVRVSDALPALADALVSEAGLPEAEISACLTEYQAELQALDQEIADILSVVPAAQRRLVTNHDALGYFAARYGFEVIGSVIPSPSGLAETNPAELEALAKRIEAAGVGAIFAETQQSTDDAESLAGRVGDIEIVTLFTGTLGDAATGADTYIGLLRTDAQLIADALR